MSPRYIGPYEFFERIGPLAYRIALLLEITQIHYVFHMRILRKYRYDPTHILKNQGVGIDDDLTYVKELVKIIGYKTK